MENLTLKIPWRVKRTLALGADMKRGFALGQGNRVELFYSKAPLTCLEDAQAFKKKIVEEMERRDFRPGAVVADLHPLYFSTRLAGEFSPEPTLVQHHKAHVASALAEHGITGEVIGVSMDGTGYGEDGAIWGGEFFVGRAEELFRAGHIKYFPLQGGDAAARETWRPALALVEAISPERAERLAEGIGPRAPLVLSAIRKGLGTVLTSSAGRLFDAAAFLILGIKENSYEAEAPIALEKAASSSPPFPAYKFTVLEEEKRVVLDPSPAIAEILERRGTAEEKAFSFHLGLAKGIIEAAKKLRERTGSDKLIFSGGVFQNRLLRGLLYEESKEAGFHPLFQHKVPIHDGGIALGQVILGGML